MSNVTTALQTIVNSLDTDARNALLVMLQDEAKVKSTSTKATSTKAKSAKAPKAVSIATAQKRVAAGESAWNIHVRSSNGNVVPFGVVLRAQRVQEWTAERAVKASEKASKPATRKSGKASKASKTKDTKVSGRRSDSPFFRMSRAELVADGSAGALAEIEYRKAKKASKS